VLTGTEQADYVPRPYNAETEKQKGTAGDRTFTAEIPGNIATTNSSSSSSSSSSSTNEFACPYSWTCPVPSEITYE